MLGIHAEWVAKAAREHPGQPIVLVGHSFGARCTAHLALGLVEVVNKGAESTTTPFDAALPSAVKGLLLCGYPIQNSKKATSPARVDVLERLWTESPLPVRPLSRSLQAESAESTAAPFLVAPPPPPPPPPPPLPPPPHITGTGACTD